MTPAQAAKLIGISPQQVRTLIRNGAMKARKHNTGIKPGFRYDISEKEAARVRSTKQTAGWPRGRKRKKRKKR